MSCKRSNCGQALSRLGRNNHRAGMLFPLLLSLSQKVAALLSSVMMGLVALLATLLFAKKAFLLSAAALAVAAWDANRRKHIAPEIHVHKVPVYQKEHVYYPEHYSPHNEDSYQQDYSGIRQVNDVSSNHRLAAEKSQSPYDPEVRTQQLPYRSPYRHRQGRG